MTGGRLGQTFAVLLAFATAAPAMTPEGLRDVAGEWSVEIVTTGRKSRKPRAATIWFVHEEGRIWVQSGKGGKTDWYRNLLADPEVSLRFDDVVVRGRATPIDDPAETERVHRLFRSKYWTARIAGWFGRDIGTGEVVRIDPEVTSGPGEAPSAAVGARAGADAPPEPRPE